VIPTDALQLAASVGFLILGARLVQRSLRNAPESQDDEATTP
jgi:hypothetical protein